MAGNPDASDPSDGSAASMTPRHDTLVLWGGWHVLLVASMIVGASHFRYGTPVWALSSTQAVLLLGVACAHLTAAAILLWRGRRGPVPLRDVLLTVGVVYGALSFVLLMIDSPYSRDVLAGALIASALALALPLLLRRRSYVIALIGLQLVVVAVSLPRGIALAAEDGPLVESFSTTFYDLELQTHEDVAPSRVLGGAIEPLAGGLLVAGGDGRLHFVRDAASGDGIAVSTLPHRVPVNHGEFVTDNDERVIEENFRVTDIAVRVSGDSLRLVASHHYWNRQQRCFVLRVSTLVADLDEFLIGSAEEWRTLFDTRPCMPLKTDPSQDPFAGAESGGRIVFLDEGTLLLTVGDFAYDGWNSRERLAQDTASHYGKTIRIALEDGSASVYTSGHRNPQGLHVAGDGSIWLTEHGPRGGDELNLVEAGANYGWPFVTLGSDYEQKEWPLSTSQGRHPGYRAPVYAWLPSSAVSSVSSVTGDLFEHWRGDLLVSSLAAGTLYRLRIRDGHVQFAEPIQVGRRIRDAVERPDGLIALLFDDGALGLLRPQPPPRRTSVYFTAETRGEAMFGSCLGCHDRNQGTAPDLRGVVGRRVAAQRGFPYSDALESLGGTWTVERLDAFLADPQGYAPGTAMRLGAIRDEAARASLVDYLDSLD